MKYQYIANIVGLSLELVGVLLLVFCILENLTGLKEDKNKLLIPQLNRWAKKYQNTPTVKRRAAFLIIAGFFIQIFANILGYCFSP